MNASSLKSNHQENSGYPFAQSDSFTFHPLSYRNPSAVIAISQAKDMPSQSGSHDALGSRYSTMKAYLSNRYGSTALICIAHVLFASLVHSNNIIDRVRIPWWLFRICGIVIESRLALLSCGLSCLKNTRDFRLLDFDFKTEVKMNFFEACKTLMNQSLAISPVQILA